MTLTATMSGPGAASTAPVPPNPSEGIEMAQRTCSVEACDRKHYGRDLCHMHYKRWERWGDPLRVAEIHGDDHARFWSKVAVTPSCVAA